MRIDVLICHFCAKQCLIPKAGVSDISMSKRQSRVHSQAHLKNNMINMHGLREVLRWNNFNRIVPITNVKIDFLLLAIDKSCRKREATCLFAPAILKAWKREYIP